MEWQCPGRIGLPVVFFFLGGAEVNLDMEAGRGCVGAGQGQRGGAGASGGGGAVHAHVGDARLGEDLDGRYQPLRQGVPVEAAEEVQVPSPGGGHGGGLSHGACATPHVQ